MPCGRACPRAGLYRAPPWEAVCSWSGRIAELRASQGPDHKNKASAAGSCERGAGYSGTRWSQWLVVSGKVKTVSSWHPAVAQDGRRERRASSTELPGVPTGFCPGPPPSASAAPLRGLLVAAEPSLPRAHLKGNSPPRCHQPTGAFTVFGGVRYKSCECRTRAAAREEGRSPRRWGVAVAAGRRELRQQKDRTAKAQ